MRRLLVSLVIVTSLIAATACGGGGPSAAEQAQQASEAAKVQRVEKTKARHEARVHELKRYLEQSRRANLRYQHARRVFNRAFTVIGVNDLDTPAGAEGAQDLRKARELYSEASIRQRLATPPAALRAINVRFARDMGQVGDLADALVDSISRNDRDDYINLDTPAGANVRSEWRLTVTAYARGAGVAMPKWSEIIGTRT